MPFTIANAMPRKQYGETSFGERLQSIRKARGFTQVQLAEAAGTTQRAISYYETEAGFPPAPAVIDLAKALRVTTDELLGVKPPKVERIDENSEARRMWKRFQLVSELPERDQKAVIRLINSLVAVGSVRKNHTSGERSNDR
jgi:transcriptional regulator with XRE-family HTH domain